MVGVFVRLKLRVLRSRLGAAGILSTLGFVLVWLAGIGSGVAGMALLSLLPRFAPGIATPLAVGVFFLVGLAWVVGPVIAASIDDALDVRRFELLPIPTVQLGIGLLAAGLVGPGSLATIIALVGGSVAGYAGLVSAVPILVTATVACVLFVVTARWALTALADLLRSRRTQEIAGLVLGLFMAIPGLFSVLVNTSGLPFLDYVDQAVTWVSWTPPGALGRAVAAFGEGDWLLGAAGLAYGSAVLWGAIVGYGRSLDRLQTTVGDVGAHRAVRGAGRALRPDRIPLPSGPIGAVAAKELIYLRRDARLRAQLIGSVIGVAVLAAVSITAVDLGVYGPFLAAIVAFLLVVALVVNQFGYDGGSMWAYLIIAPDLGTVLKGKNLAWVMFCTPLLVLAAVGGGVVSADGRYVPAAIVGSTAILLVWMGVGNATSLLGPARIPESNPFGNRGASGASVVASLGGLAAAGILNLPVLAAVGIPVVFFDTGWATLGSVAALLYAVGLYALSFRWIGPLADSRAFAVTAVIDGE